MKSEDGIAKLDPCGQTTDMAHVYNLSPLLLSVPMPLERWNKPIHSTQNEWISLCYYTVTQGQIINANSARDLLIDIIWVLPCLPFPP